MNRLRATLMGAAASWALAGVADAADPNRFPPPEFSGDKTLPTMEQQAPRADWLNYLDVFVLVAGLSVGSWLLLKTRSKKGMTWLGIFSLGYFGFFRDGCVCAIGSIQNVAKATFVVARPEIHVNPGHIVLDKLSQEARGENMVAIALRRTLQEIGRVALKVFHEFLADRERPHTFAADAADSLERGMQFAAIGEYTRVTRG